MSDTLITELWRKILKNIWKFSRSCEILDAYMKQYIYIIMYIAFMYIFSYILIASFKFKLSADTKKYIMPTLLHPLCQKSCAYSTDITFSWSVHGILAIKDKWNWTNESHDPRYLSVDYMNYLPEILGGITTLNLFVWGELCFVCWV